MVKLQATFLGREVSGKLGAALQYSSLRRGPSAGKRRRPRQPRTLPQRATRIFMGQLAQHWANLTQTEHDSWYGHPDISTLSPYHCYLKANAGRFHLLGGERYYPQDFHCYPAATWPADESTPAAALVNRIWTAGQGLIRVQFDIYVPADNWLVLHWLRTTEHTWPVPGTTIHTHLAHAAGNYEVDLPNIPAGTQRVMMIGVSRTGKPNSLYYTSGDLLVT